MAKSKFNNNQEVVLSGLFVEVRNGDFGKAMRKFKKKIAEDGILQELRQREYYESKGTKRRKAKEAAIRRYKKQRLKDKINLGY
jgi:small subunit ribosomal protein S21